jgi:hypothetical protein
MSARAMVWFVVSFFATMAVIFWALHPVMWHLTREAREIDPARSAVERPEWLQPGAPKLQPSEEHDTLPREDLAAMRAAEDRVFAHLGWLDEKRGVTVPRGLVERVGKGTTGLGTGKVGPGAGMAPGSTTQATTRATTRAGGGK